MTDGPDLGEALKRLHTERVQFFRTQWDRYVPFADQIVDRWERAELLGFGAGTSVYDSSLIIGDVRVGRDTWIGPSTVLDGSGGGLSIGDTCSISAGVQIYTHDSVRWAVSGGIAKYETAPVSIGDHTYVGPLTVIQKGVTIGKRCLIGAHSVVNKDLPDGSIAWGATCKIVGRVRVDAAGTVDFEYFEERFE